MHNCTVCIRVLETCTRHAHSQLQEQSWYALLQITSVNASMNAVLHGLQSAHIFQGSESNSTEHVHHQQFQVVPISSSTNTLTCHSDYTYFMKTVSVHEHELVHKPVLARHFFKHFDNNVENLVTPIPIRSPSLVGTLQPALPWPVVALCYPLVVSLA